MERRSKPGLAVKSGRGRQIADVRNVPCRSGATSNFAKNIRLEHHPQTTQAQHQMQSDEVRSLKDTLHKVRVEKAILETEKCGLNRLTDERRDELRRARQEICDLKSSQAQQCQCQSPVIQRPRKSLASNLKTGKISDEGNSKLLIKRNEELKTEIDALTTRLGTEKARYDANFSLIFAQKTQLERENTTLKENLYNFRATNEVLKKQLAETDGRFEKLLEEMKFQSKKEYSLSSSALLNEMKSNVLDLKSELKLAERHKALSDSKIAEITENFDASRKENEKLRNKLASADRQFRDVDDLTGPLSLKVSELENQLLMKEREIAQLKAIINDLENEYRNFRKCLTDQETNLTKLQRELSKSQSLNEELSKSRTSLADEHEKLKLDVDRLSFDNKNLNKQLGLSVDEQEKWKRSAQRFKEEIISYETLFKEKEHERLNLFAKYREITSELRRLETGKACDEKQQQLDSQAQNIELENYKDQIRDLQARMDKMSKEHSFLKDQLSKCEGSFERVQYSWQTAKCQKESLMADLASLRQEMISADTFKVELVQEMSKKDADICRLNQFVEDLGVELELCRCEIQREKDIVGQLDQQLKVAREAQLLAEVDAQEKRDEVRLCREKINECELKLELQGQDLKMVRSKLKQAEVDVKLLKRQIIEDQSSAAS